ncbi:pyrimidine 5'-nucleotidase [Castellaniella caeni]|uniref:pyrimidine 5'-nucleotidase n=1 Tax=Castellaniella caeni TaxID=266123 RepID=UPI00082B8EB6|nr:pyrimidine 5'-nucleotidase [Castellaniella caeni]
MSPLQAPSPLRRARPIPSDAPVWLFDLDNTLHDASRAIFRTIDQRMGAAVAQALNLPPEEADVVRRRYWKRYGATAIGLVKHHQVNLQQFLRTCHDFDVRPLVHADRGLKARLRALPGRRIVLTNAPAHYARRVLQALNILQEFDGLWAIDHMMPMGLPRPKPSLALMRQVLARLDVPAQRVILVEDTLRNLKSARQVGMRTAYLYHPGTPFSHQQHGRDLYVDVRVNRLSDLLMQAHAGHIPGIRGHA